MRVAALTFRGHGCCRPECARGGWHFCGGGLFAVWEFGLFAGFLDARLGVLPRMAGKVRVVARTEGDLVGCWQVSTLDFEFGVSGGSHLRVVWLAGGRFGYLALL